MTQATATQATESTTTEASMSMGEALGALAAMLPSEVSEPMLGSAVIAAGVGLIGLTTAFIVSSCMVGVLMTFALALLALVILALTAWAAFEVTTSCSPETRVSAGRKAGAAWNMVTGWFSSEEAAPAAA